MSNAFSAFPERFWDKVQFEPNTGCWLWIAYCDRDGYGRFWFNKNMWLAHRLSFEAQKGSIPEGLDLDHLCRIRNCVNPDHLEPVTSSENMRRSPIHFSAINGNKTHCLRGHPYDEANTYLKSSGHRNCRICNKHRNREYRKRLALKERQHHDH